MSGLSLGLLAALAWGLHDLCVRRMSRRADIPSSLLVVLGVGALAQVPLAVRGAGEARAFLAPGTVLVAFATGAAFVVASYALYRAFAAGPVRLVAPVVGAYPIATTAFAIAGGASVGAGHWIAVLAIVAGVALVASRNAAGESAYALGPTLGWSLAAALAFATTFALGHRLSARLDPALVSFATRVAATLLLGLVVALARRWRRPARSDVPVLVLMGALDALALGAVLFAGGLSDAVLASVAASLFGVVTIVLARLFLAEAMSGRQWLGVGVAFGAIAWLSVA